MKNLYHLKIPSSPLSLILALALAHFFSLFLLYQKENTWNFNVESKSDIFYFISALTQNKTNEPKTLTFSDPTLSPFATPISTLLFTYKLQIHYIHNFLTFHFLLDLLFIFILNSIAPETFLLSVLINVLLCLIYKHISVINLLHL